MRGMSRWLEKRHPQQSRVFPGWPVTSGQADTSSLWQWIADSRSSKMEESADPEEENV